MAKPYANVGSSRMLSTDKSLHFLFQLPGTSGHIHVSLRTSEGKNVFGLSEAEVEAGGRKDAQYDETKFISQEAEWFLAGLLEGLPDGELPMRASGCKGKSLNYTTLSVVPTLVPTINGYKRLVGGEVSHLPFVHLIHTDIVFVQSFWAPNAVTYGYDSRAASIRIISPPSVSPSATRFEVRVPGADVQPHLALSSIFRLGLRGIDKKLTLPLRPISEITTLEEKKTVKKLATSLEAATLQMMREGSVAREVLGDDFVDHYGGTRQHEVDLWNAAVTNWEGACATRSPRLLSH